MDAEGKPTREACALARVLDGFHRMNHAVEAADCIVGLGTNDPRVADRAAELFREGLAPRVVFTGGVSGWTHGLYQASEARAFARLAILQGVPEHCILLEEQATNTGENIKRTRALLESKDLPRTRLILVQKPYMERRTFATCKRFWPEPDIRVTSPRLDFDDYPLPWLPLSEVIRIMVGDLHRILIYPQLGYQVEQAVPEEVRDAFDRLVRLGYDTHLVPDQGHPQSPPAHRTNAP